MLYAEKALISRVEPGLWGPPESYEWYRVTPQGVGLQIFCSGVQDLSRDLSMAQANIARSVRNLAEEQPNCIIVGGLPVIGHGYKHYAATLDFVESLRKEIGIPLVTDLTATVDALKGLGVKRLAAATPYPEDVDLNHKELLEDCGFEVLKIKGLRLTRTRDINRLPEDASYRLAKEVCAEAPEAEAIFIFCPGWPVVGNLARLETELKRPVLTTITVQLYSAFKAMRLKQPVNGYGRLLEELPGWD